MSNILDSKFWEIHWNKAKEESTVNINNDNFIKWINFWDSISDIYDEIELFSHEIVNNALLIMKEEKLISEESKVLEIGSGSGNFTIPLSYEVQEIFAIEPSEGMLKRLKNKIENLKISNINPVKLRWEDAAFSEKFELVFAAFCPGINNINNLLKMKAYSKEHALLITFSKSDSIFTMRNELWKMLTKKDFISKGYHIIFPFNILYSLGYRPQLKKIRILQTVERKVESLIKQYMLYFEIFFPLDEIKRRIIIEFFEQRAVDGKLIFNVEREIYLMWW